MGFQDSSYRGNYKGYLLKSSFEYAFAIYLDYLELNWNYENKTYDLGSKKYRPDFFIYDSNGNLKHIYEVKGTILQDDIDKLKGIKEKYNLNVKFVTKKTLIGIYKKLPFDFLETINKWKNELAIDKPKMFGEHNPNFGNKHTEQTKEVLKDKTKKLWEDKEIADKMLSGLEKGTETIKKNKGKESNQRTPREIRICPICKTEFKVMVSDNKTFCSQKCSGTYAYEKGTEKYKANRKEQHNKVIDIIDNWILNNKESIQFMQYNQITTFMQSLINEISEKTDITEIRTIIKAYTGRYIGRKEFLSILKAKADEKIC